MADFDWIGVEWIELGLAISALALALGLVALVLRISHARADEGVSGGPPSN